DGDNLFSELRTTDGSEFKNEQAVLPFDKIATGEQKRFIGLKKEDEVELDIPSNISDETFITEFLGENAPQNASGKYIFKVTNINRVEPAAINQELFDRVFGKDVVTTEEEFINKVKETIGENYNRESEHFLNHHIEDYFIANTAINLPDEFLKNWLKVSGAGKIDDAVLANEFEEYKRGLKWDLVKNR